MIKKTTLFQIILFEILFCFSWNAISKQPGNRNCYTILSENVRGEEYFVPNVNTNDYNLIFLAKISNEIDDKNKIVWLKFEILDNLKGKAANFKLDVSHIYKKEVEPYLAPCSILWESYNQEDPLVMLVATSKSIVLLPKTASMSDFNNSDLIISTSLFMQASIGFYLDETDMKIRNEYQGALNELRFLEYDIKSEKEEKSLKLKRSNLKKLKLSIKNYRKVLDYFNHEIDGAYRYKKNNQYIIDQIKVFKKNRLQENDKTKDFFKKLLKIYPERSGFYQTLY